MEAVPECSSTQDLQIENLQIPSCRQARAFNGEKSRSSRKATLVRDVNNSHEHSTSEPDQNGENSLDLSTNLNGRKDVENPQFKRCSKTNNGHDRPPLTFENGNESCVNESDFATTSPEARTSGPCSETRKSYRAKISENVIHKPVEASSAVSNGDNLSINEREGFTSNNFRKSRGHVVGGRYVRQNISQSRKRSKDGIFIPPLEELHDFRFIRNRDGQFQRKNNVVHNFGSRKDNYGNHSRNDDIYYNQGNSSTNLNLVEQRIPKTLKATSRQGRTNTDYKKKHFKHDMNFSTVHGANSKFCSSDKSTNNLKLQSRSLDRNRMKHPLSKRSGYKDDEAAQLERLTYQLREGEYECMVCCDAIKVKDQIWNCRSCYHVFHLWCIRKWARSPAACVEESGWRCPGCQNICKRVPFQYYCFCGKCKEPEVNHHLTPHSCGEVCGNLRSTDCPHKCNILCHPGPCPPCSASVIKECGCGKLKKTVLCKQASSLTCDSVCGKILNCGVHECEELCHSGDCQPCPAIFTEECFCEKTKRDVPCSVAASNGEQFSCGNTCGKMLNCGHYCDLLCHEGPCNDCRFLPSILKLCPCGKTLLDSMYEKDGTLKRNTCTDPVPLCGLKCEKVLKCGPKGNPHKCGFQCHTGDCPPCDQSTSVKCRCGAVSKELPCSTFLQSPALLCERRCNRRKVCGRHKCLNLCCVNTEHKCELICNKKLSCGNHQCQELCHNGNCPTCPNVSFEELSCRCGSSVLFPPVPCGTQPPECKEKCNRSHPCDHPVQHSCHSYVDCPPCTVLTTMWCFGKHMLRNGVQCFLDGISCGLPCEKPLPCGFHKCLDVCHMGSCLKNGSQCTQPCSMPRSDCGHPCRAPCHSGPCPSLPCKTKVNMKCPCGHRSEVVVCSDNSKSYHLMSVSMLASTMQDIKLGHSVNISEVFGKKNKLNRLDCNEECAILERNKRLALALQIQNPELSSKPGSPSYSEFLKEEVQKNQSFVCNIHDKLTELVQLAKQSKQKSRSYAFPPMNRDQRHVIHELAEFFGCETQSYDKEPKKSVTVTAFRDKCWLPFASVLSVVQREMGIRKGPTPMWCNPIKPRVHEKEIQALEQKTPAIDYFNYPRS